MTDPFLFPVSTVEAAALSLLKDPDTDEYRKDLAGDEIRLAFTRARTQLPTASTESQMDQLVELWVQKLTATSSSSDGGPLIKDDHIPWLQKSKTDIVWRRWFAYRHMLSDSGRSGGVLDKLDHFSDEILDLVGDPRNPGIWNRRGLVIGDVQSGKTQNYLALMNKAADAGYRVIIVLSGNTEYLRQQTHSRIDEGFIGRDTTLAGMHNGARVPRDMHIGIGNVDREIADATSLTTTLMDYLQVSRTAGDVALPTTSSPPLVFVVKKNTHVLKAVQGWAQAKAGSQPRIDLPLLLIDDESDYASINTNDESDDPTAINSAIRRLLNLFTRSSYLAITATPFANIFIDDEATACLTEDGEELPDLFPEDFIYPLDAPSNYVGIRAVFGRTPDEPGTQLQKLKDAVRWLPLKHKKLQRPDGLSSSLQEALRTFLLANAVLDHRLKAPAKRSMLVNVSRFTDVQNHVADALREALFQYKTAIQLHATAYAAGRTHPLLDELKGTFTRQYTASGASWESVLSQLSASVAEVRVKVYNSAPGIDPSEFDGEVPERQIAIGGDLLSRGLTLDGLVVSYFHRNVAAADTMMQMARWFGYRDGYQDICRLWISEGSAADYRFIATAVEELRVDLAYMRRSKMIPRDFGLAVQQHPESLLITARNKSRHAMSAQKEINLLGRNLETTKLSTSVEVQRENHTSIVKLLDEAVGNGCAVDRTRRGYTRIRSVPKDLIADALLLFSAAPDDVLFNGASLERMVRSGEGDLFKEWDIVVVNGSVKRNAPLTLGPLSGCYPVERQMLFRPLFSKDGTPRGASLWVSGKRGRLAGPEDLQKLLDQEIEQRASGRYMDALRELGQDAKSSIPETAFYGHLSKPQLLIYPLYVSPGGTDQSRTIEVEDLAELPRNAVETKRSLDEAQKQHLPFMALKVALPKTGYDPRGRNGRAKYLLNRVAQRYWVSDYEQLA
ncbi:Z1 domain-containing protein [Arthrobacter zhangbolii]|uniref:Z1 domain-containing protein n=1 Tax=Arthrobacter zhangbolii TaxID=2886936 RepID=A0A9X1S9M6_9MICC|nr:Z1 domain-containing protein [Arthrobacter zhangbolii]MCC3273268.1 Z1 domain-containing protein [Arthrobacter zhangbolii]UON92749.1 Z1 domain-containing protein [Arthrobacter zhangbolii]